VKTIAGQPQARNFSNSSASRIQNFGNTGFGRFDQRGGIELGPLFDQLLDPVPKSLTGGDLAFQRTEFEMGMGIDHGRKKHTAAVIADGMSSGGLALSNRMDHAVFDVNVSIGINRPRIDHHPSGPVDDGLGRLT